MYYKSQLRCQPIPDMSYCDPDIEIIFIKLCLTRTRPIYYGLTYRPPSGNIERFLDKIEEIVTDLRSKGNCEINISGDVNIDILKKDTKSKMYLTYLKRLGLTNVINQVTHIKNVGLGFSLIDHFLTTDEHLYNTTGAIPTTF